MNDILNHITKSIESSTLNKDPFKHKFVNNVFPKEYYLKLLNKLPSKSNYIALTKTGLVSKNYNSERFVFDPHNKENMDKLDQERKEFWNEMLKILMSKELFELVFSTFKETIDNRIKNFSQHEIKELGKSNFNISIKSLLVKDLTKYNLGAHTDHIGKLITFLFYLPSNNDLSSIGTALYQPIDKLKEKEMTKHFTHEQTQQKFKKIKTCPFVPNSLLIFPRTSVSFHGVEEVNINQKERNLMQLNYYISKGK